MSFGTHKTKRQSFLHDMIVGEFYTTITVERECLSSSLSAKLVDALGKDKAMYVNAYADLIVYTKSLDFVWREKQSIPEEITNFEDWWQLTQQRGDDVQAYRFFSTEIDMTVFNAFWHAMKSAQTIWTPAFENLLETALDPKSPGSKKSS
jgi:hypothetical protein